MVEKERKYPFDYSDKELYDEMVFKVFDDDPGAPAKALKNIVALTEIQRRSSNKFTRWSFILSITVIFLSFIAIYFAYSQNKTSVNWQKKQLQILENIENKLK